MVRISVGNLTAAFDNDVVIAKDLLSGNRNMTFSSKINKLILLLLYLTHVMIFLLQ